MPAAYGEDPAESGEEHVDFAEGRAFAGYRIERKLGAGGMGTVYLAQHPRLPRKDALKVLADGRGRDPEFRERFLREAEAAARLDHPNLVTVRDRGEEGDLLWIAMRYVDGVDLAALIRRGRAALGIERVVHLITEAAQGLDEIHRAGLLHRDVKPANILVAEQVGGPDRVFITDFGIAHSVATSTVDARTSGVTGTLAYAAPELLRGGRIDHRADVYSLGCTLYHLLTGSPPFPRDTLGAVMYAHLNEPPPRPSARDAQLPKGFDAVIARAMAKNPAHRFAGCGELAAAARVALSGGEVAGPPRRWKRGRIPVVALLVAVAATGVIFAMNPRDPAPDPVRSNAPRTGTTEPAEWGEVAFIAEAFPDLLPPNPLSVGYQELGFCQVHGPDSEVVSFGRSIASPQLVCLGDTDPVWSVTITCNTDRSAIAPGVPVALVEGNEPWRRPSGSGRLFWGKERLPEEDSGALSGLNIGILDVYFDDANRNFCWMRVVGAGASGAELKTKWWPNAPL
ncbi:serine/threonine-protein kinase [Nocardia sp. IFM 10818]